MEFIAHRVNTREELRSIPDSFGVELDLRDNLWGRIYIQHNPFEEGEDFEEYLSEYHHGTMILNVKSERIEHRVKELIDQFGVERYFFLDSTFPMIKHLSDFGEKKIALRFSEYEGIDTLRAMKGRVSWVWIDTFSRIPLNTSLYEEIKAMGYKMCFVSPELQGQPKKVEDYIKEIADAGYEFDAVCSKVYMAQKWGLLN